MKTFKLIPFLAGLVLSLEQHGSRLANRGNYWLPLLDNKTTQETNILTSASCLETGLPLQLEVHLQIGDLSGSGTIGLTKLYPAFSPPGWDEAPYWMTPVSASETADTFKTSNRTCGNSTLSNLGMVTPSAILGSATSSAVNLTRFSSSSLFPSPTALDTVTSDAGVSRMWRISSLVMWQVIAFTFVC